MRLRILSYTLLFAASVLMPIDRTTFLDAGFLIWDNPLLNSTFSFVENSMMFATTLYRVLPISLVLHEEKIDGDKHEIDIQPIHLLIKES